jgi:hypothetical protein
MTKLILCAAVAAFALPALAASAQTAPGATAPMPRPVLLNGCSLTSASTASATDPTGTIPNGTVQHTFTVQYTVKSDKTVSAVQVQGSAAGQTEVWTDTNPFPKSGPVSHSVNFPGDIIVDEVSCKIKSVKFADGSTWSPAGATS